MGKPGWSECGLTACISRVGLAEAVRIINLIGARDKDQIDAGQIAEAPTLFSRTQLDRAGFPLRAAAPTRPNRALRGGPRIAWQHPFLQIAGFRLYS